MSNIKLSEMARIASGLELTSDYQSKFDALDPKFKESKKLNNIINNIKENPGTVLKKIALDLYNREDTASVNQAVRFLKQSGIVADTGLVTPKKEKTVSQLSILKSALNKMSNGETFTPEESTLIKSLYRHANQKPVKEDDSIFGRMQELAGIQKEYIHNDTKVFVVRSPGDGLIIAYTLSQDPDTHQRILNDLNIDLSNDVDGLSHYIGVYDLDTLLGDVLKSRETDFYNY